MIEIKEYENKYAEGMSKVILDNLYKINIKDYDKQFVDNIAKWFTKEQIQKNFPQRLKCFVAVKENEVVGTASINKFKGDKTGEKYIILTVFVKIENHHQGIGKMLIRKIEEYAKSIGAKELVVPASIYGCEFYKKLGYEYLNGIKELNDEGEYIMIKKYKGKDD